MDTYFNYFKYLAAALVMGFAAHCYADEITEARDMIDAGELESARELLLPLKNNYQAVTLLGRAAMMDYDFTEAARLYKSAKSLSQKIKTADTEELDDLEKQLEIAETFLERVEKLQVIDSIVVPKENFFKAMRLPASAGHLSAGADFPLTGDKPEYFYSSEGDDYMIWAHTDSLGYDVLMESIRLNDGSWNVPQALDEELAGGGDARFPFMMADGVTLYYSADGDDSIGGLDIFVATRDAANGEFLQPQNLGMPYSSPADDYMLAIDELNGIGWLATDRNFLGDKLTIYVFIVNDLRKNYDSDDDNIISFARIADIGATQDADSDYSELLRTIANIEPSGPSRAEEFRFQIAPGKIYTSLSDFRTSKAQNLMKLYLKAVDEQNNDLNHLADLRKAYKKSPSESLKREILSLETKTEEVAMQLPELRGQVRLAELN